MRAATKMMMLNTAREGNQGGNRGGRSEMEMGGYQNEMRRGSRGNLTWDTREPEDYGRSGMRGGYGEMRRGGRSEMREDGGNMRQEMRGGYGNARSEMDEMESRRRYRRDSRGRFRSEMDGGSGGEMHYPGTVPPIYEEYDQPRQIGFSAHGGERKEGLRMIHGGAHHQDMELDEQTAHEWMESLQNEDGTKGPHWTKEQTTQVMKQKNINCDPLEFWVAMNAMYSDYFNVAKKSNVNNIDFYVGMAKAFLDDKDAKDGKLAAYYEYVVK